MRKRLKWTERTFTFDFPTGIYPEIIERLRGAVPRLAHYLRDKDQRILTFREQGRWSILENAGHLIDLEPLVSQRIDEYRAGLETLHAADMSNRKTFEANYNESSPEQVVDGFARARTQIAERLDELPPEIFGRRALHPRLNVSMRLVDMLFFQAEHDDYHLTRISELLRHMQ